MPSALTLRTDVSALASPYAARLDTFRKAHGISSSMRFCGWPSNPQTSLRCNSLAGHEPTIQ